MTVEEKVKAANHSEIHRVTGISLSGVNRILNGRRNATSINLSKIATEVGVTMDELHAYLTMLKARNRGRRGKRAVA